MTAIFRFAACAAMLLTLAGCRSRSASDPLFPAPFMGRWGYVDQKGRKVIAPKYENARPFSEGLAAVALHGRWGYINFKGQEVIPALHRSAQEFRGGLAIVDSGLPEQPYGLIDPSGSWVVQPSFRSLMPGDEAGDFYIGTKAVGPGSSFYNRRGEPLFGPYETASAFAEGRARVKYGSEGWIDTQGRFTPFPEAFPESSHFSGGLIVARKGSKVGYMEPGGLFIISPRFDRGGDFHEGLAPVEENGRWFFIDPVGAIAASLPDNVRSADPLSDGRSLVMVDRKLGFVDRMGKWVAPPRWDDAESFKAGLAFVGEWRTSTVAYLNTSGNIVWEGAAPH